MDYSKIFVNGEWIEAESKEMIEVMDPRTEEIIASVPRSNEADVTKAIDSAKKAFEDWQFTNLKERIQMMENFRGNLEKNIDTMADIISKELGADFEFAKSTHIQAYIDDIDNYIRVVKEYEFEKDYGEFLVRKEPVGVVAAITPWNYPLGQITKKIVPALLAGNTVVLKPSQQTPLVAQHLTKAIEEAGFPKGVFNLVTGVGAEVGNILTSSKDVDMVSFTGSTSGGINVGKDSLEDVKKIALELGGKSASVVLEDADLDIVMDTTLDTVYNNTGQTCSALTRMLIPKTRKEEIEKLVIEKTKEYKFGNSENPDTVIAPLISQKQFDKVKYYVEHGLEEGAKLLLGEVPKKDGQGFYVGPVVFTDVDNDMKIAQEEIFGPVLVLIEYDSIDEAIEIANDVDYGLSGAVFGNGEDARYVANRMKTGMVIINGQTRTHSAPFGGYKHSGIGREGGQFGLEEYLETKTLFI